MPALAVIAIIVVALLLLAMLVAGGRKAAGARAGHELGGPDDDVHTYRSHAEASRTSVR